MHLDVQDLRSFYYRTQLGRAAQRSIRDQVVEHWPDTKGLTVAGFGFAVPLLRPFLADSRRVIALMPGPQGVMAWPQGMPNVSVLCEETLLAGRDRHRRPPRPPPRARDVREPLGRAGGGVAGARARWPRPLRRAEPLRPLGAARRHPVRLRASLFASQLEAQLRRHDFLPERHGAALFQPPSEKRFWLKTGGIWEGMGRRVSKSVAGGVLIVEASKQLEAPRRPGLPGRRPAPASHPGRHRAAGCGARLSTQESRLLAPFLRRGKCFFRDRSGETVLSA